MKNMRIFRFDSPLMRFFNRLADIVILNVLYVVCCLPVITAGAATTALYSCAMNLDEPNEEPVFRRFFRVFRSDFGKSTALFGIWAAAMAVVALNVWFYLVLLENVDGWYRVLPMIPTALVLLVSSYLFPLQAWVENSLWQLLKNAVSLTVVHLPTTVIITAINCIPVVILLFFTDVFLYLLAVWTLLAFAMIAYFNGYLLKKVFRKHIAATEPEDKENGEDI